MTKDETQLSRIKAGLKCSDAEAAEILAYDKAIDHGEKTPHDLTPAQNKVAQSYARTGTRKPTVYKFTTRERKPSFGGRAHPHLRQHGSHQRGATA